MDEISELRLFVRIVAAGSLSETARRLSSSLPATSRRLAGLEERLGVRLIDRSTRRFALTEEGDRLHERAVKILADTSMMPKPRSVQKLASHRVIFASAHHSESVGGRL